MKQKNITFIFIGFELLFFLVVFLIFKFTKFLFVWTKVLPVFAIWSGISLFITGLIAKKKLRPVYLVPSLVFIFLGCFFMLFSFNIIKITLREFIFRWWPCLPVFAVGFLVGMFLFKEKVSK
ncbi:MAG: hypothetical protein GX220_09065 [Treponema sp.]|nr:hypothetical protein [Treponema sp.]